MGKALQEQLREEILHARKRIYSVHGATPLDVIDADGIHLFLKREDLGPIHAYKWRGAYNRMATLSPKQIAAGVVTASAGNHAQGIALGAKRLGTQARIYMPKPTPLTKQRAVAFHGGDAVQVRLVGDTYDAAKEAALVDAQESGAVLIGAFDDLVVMGGQGTIADEIVMSGQGPFDVAYLQIGGGGMAAAVACWLKFYFPQIQIVGVEGEGQACMKAAIEAGKPVVLENCDVFSDGTAVRKAGDLTYPLCRDLIDRFITVSNDQLCAAIQFVWEKRRAVLEPAGAMGLAGMLADKDKLGGKKVVAVACGANMDFGQMPTIARRASIGGNLRRFLRIEMPEEKGALLKFLQRYVEDVNIVEFQYGKTGMPAHFTIGFAAPPQALERLEQKLQEDAVRYEDVTSDQDVAFRIIHYEASQMHLPYFVQVDFHERSGSLTGVLEQVSSFASICYFNYSYSGERVGRALIGFEFESREDRAKLEPALNNSDGAYRSWQPVPENVLKRIL